MAGKGAGSTAGRTAERPADDPCHGLRRDAQLNRQRILAAAQELISSRGEGVSMDDIAAAAGVGVGTLYRRFASKEALVEQLVADVREELVRAADRALERRDGSGLEGFLREAGRYFASRPGCVAALWHHSPARSPSVVVTDRLAHLLDEARSHHRVAPGVTVGDVLVLLRAMHAITDSQPEAAGEWERLLDVHLAGLGVVGTQVRASGAP